MAEEIQISISLYIGFGFSAKGIELGDDGARILVYRFIPAACWSNNAEIINAYINEAAKVFPTFDEFPPSLLTPQLTTGTRELTPAGKAFYESCPMYAKLTAKEPWIEWEQHHPEGGVAWKMQANQFGALATVVVSEWPINLWAQKLFDPWKEWLYPHPQGRIALYMQNPLPGAEKSEPDEEGWHKSGLDNALADVSERVEYPWGPIKVALRSCEEGRVEACLKMRFTDEFKLLPCTLAHKGIREEPFKWREHHVWRWELPLHLMPRAIKWFEDEDVGHPGAWSSREIVPCYKWNTPEVKFNLNKGERKDWLMTGIFYTPFEGLDPVKLATYEHDLEELARANLG